jgi:levansucrase
MTTPWTHQHLATIDPQRIPAAPVIARSQTVPLLPGIDLWDYWPVTEADGRVARIEGGTLWMLLSAPALGDPDLRHGIARIRLMHERDGLWRDLGPLFREGFTPGSREWSGSAIVDADHRRLTLYFTAAGVRGESRLSYRQRLFETSGDLDGVQPSNWSMPRECVAPDGRVYTRDMEGGGAIGTIKAFRDPDFFRDPADGQEYLLFTGSLAQSRSPWNGAIGIARRAGEAWALLPPLVTADGVNNELERPHLIARDGRYYLFWCTQAKVFADGITAPNGLYGMVAESLAGPWRPLNGSGLVLANPSAAAFQAYSWLVLHDLRIISFVDLAGTAVPPADARRHFGGTPAPVLRIAIEDGRTRLA